MGRYINPEKGSKEEWLRNNGTLLGMAPKEMHLDDDYYPVVLVNNGAFTAAAIALSQDELTYFRNPKDERPKMWFAVRKEILRRSGFIN